MRHLGRLCVALVLGVGVLPALHLCLAAGAMAAGLPSVPAASASPAALDTPEHYAPVDPPPAGSAPLLAAEAGVTALAGRVLDTDGTPLRGVRVADGSARDETDAQGRFLLRGVRAGWDVLVIDGHHAIPVATGAGAAADEAVDHGYYEARVAAAAGRTTQLAWTSWLPRIDHDHEVAIASPTSEPVVVRAAAIPGLELRIPKGAVITDPAGQLVHAVGITPIPVRRTPFPLPVNVNVPVYFTAQPGGATITGADGQWLGVQVVYPNYHHELPRARGTLWRYEPEGLGWSPYGIGTVTADGSQIVPEAGTRIYSFTGAMINYGLTPPAVGPNPPPPDGNPKGPDPVDLSTGLYVQTQTDLAVSDVLPLAVTRTYRPADTNQRSFGVGMSNTFDTFLWSANEYQVASLVGPDGSQVQYTRIINPANPTDNNYNDAHFITNTPGVWYQSRIDWNGNGWNLIRQDGLLLVFGENAPLQYIQDRFGNRVTITRTGGTSGNITQVSSPTGRFIQFGYSGNLITSATDNIGRTVSYTYDGSERLSTVTDPDGGVTTYTWNSSNQVQSIKDARGNTFITNTYDSNDRALTQTLADGSVFSYAYTLGGSGNVTEADVTDPRGYVRKVTFNGSQYQLTDKRAVGTSQELDYSYTRDPVTNYATSLLDPLGRTTNWVYDQFGNLTSVTRLAGTSGAVTTSYTYSPNFNQLASVTDPLSHTTTIQSNPLGEVTSITDPLSHVTSFTYNGQGEVTTITDPLSNVTTLSYDHGDLASVTDPLLRTTSFYTDAIGRRVRATDPLGDQAQWVHDPIDGVHQAIDPLGSVTTISYNADGYVASVVDARSNTTSYTYDSSGRLTVRTDPLGYTDQITSYDGNGNPLTAIDRKSQTTTRTYDPINRIGGATYADSSTTAYTWDNGNRLTQVADSLGGTITRTFDGLDRLTSETTPEGTISYTYDAASRRSTMTGPLSGSSTYTYNYTFDNANRLTQISAGGVGTNFSYDNDNRLTSVTFPSGMVGTYSYDNASQLSGITYTSGSTTVGTLTYGYDLAGRITSRGGTLFQSVLSLAFSSAVYDAANRLNSYVSAGTTTYPTWDLNGSLTYDGSLTLSWDARNRLTSTTAPNSFTYDGLNRRQSTTYSSSTSTYLYDGFNVAKETQGSVAGYIQSGLGIDQRFTWTELGVTSTYLTDALGSTVALANSSGTVQTSYGYDPWGETYPSGSATGSTYQFAGREHNAATNLYYNRARYYRPAWSRFISEDPIGFAGGINLYTYAGNNPLNFRDPSGLMREGPPVGSPSQSPTPPTPPTQPCETQPSAGDPPPAPAPIPAVYEPSVDPSSQYNPPSPSGAEPSPPSSIMAPSNGSITSQGGGGFQLARFDDNQAAVIDLAQRYRRGLTLEQGTTLMDWANEYGLSARLDPSHGGALGPHFHIGTINHIPLLQGQ